VIKITDEAEAFTILEPFGAADFDFTIQHAQFLLSSKQIVFFLFCPTGISKGAHVFTFDNPPIAGEIENQLLSAIMQFGGDQHSDSLREAASEAIREFLETKGANHYFFDAH
jgi:hypothetical protein